jgi:hypothetical protein
VLSPHQQQGVGHGEKLPDIFDRRSPRTEFFTTVRVSRPATWYSTYLGPVCQDPQSPYGYQRRRQRHRSVEQAITDMAWEESANRQVQSAPSARIYRLTRWDNISLLLPSLAHHHRCFLQHKLHGPHGDMLTRSKLLNAQRIDATSSPVKTGAELT